MSGVETTRDPTSIELTTPSGPVVVEYSRAAATARLGGAELPKGENILVLSVGRDGRATPRWTGRLDTRITRGDDVVQALLQQSPALRQLKLISLAPRGRRCGQAVAVRGPPQIGPCL